MSKSPLTARLRCESLEAREVPAVYNPLTTADLIAAVTDANNSPEADEIRLTGGDVYTLTVAISADHGANGLPVITAAGGPLKIVGQGNRATIERDTTADYFRLLGVAANATLTLENVRLRGGHAYGSTTSPPRGGAVFNQGTLNLTDVLVTRNTAQSSSPSVAAVGGGIYSEGVLKVVGGKIQNNDADGYVGGDERRIIPTDHVNKPYTVYATAGGDGFGGGVYVAGGSAEFVGVTVTGNSATGGQGGLPKKAPRLPSGSGIGGGIYVAVGVPANGIQLDTFTRQHVTGNTTTTSNPDTFGI